MNQDEIDKMLMDSESSESENYVYEEDFDLSELDPKPKNNKQKIKTDQKNEINENTTQKISK